MTNNNHPITPPPELVKQWLAEFYGPESMPGMAPGEMVLHVAAVAARWGADQELETCCEWLLNSAVDGAKTPEPYIAAGPEAFINALRAARRPKPPSLKEQALAVVENSAVCDHLSIEHAAILRRALESLLDHPSVDELKFGDRK